MDPKGWAKFDYVRMPEYRWGILLAAPEEGRTVPFGEHFGEPAWQEVPGEYRAMLRRLLVIQGDKDGTVDWKYNLELMSKKFPNAKVEMILGANHELFNEAMEYKQQALNFIAKYFRQN